ncbi:MAG: glycosyltransferase [Ignavibacteriales bacterium]|nr:glycosyltransferase [Ignavibacteriales bacterium]
MVEIASIVLAVSALYYLWFVGNARRGLRLLLAQSRTTAQPQATVIVPARNEQENLSRCLDALLAQTYPAEKVQIIISDDGSEDRTAEIVRSYALKNPRIQLVQLGMEKNYRPTKKRGRKPEAIACAIEHAAAEIVLTTDADCETSPTWVAEMVSYFTPEVGFVSGPVAELPRPEFFARLRALEFFGLVLTSAGRIGIQSPINASGANLAFRRSLYQATGGFDFNAIKSDEETLMHKVFIRQLGKIAFASAPGAKVFTRPSRSVRSFWHQRLRWGEMQGRYERTSLLWELSGIYFAFLLWAATVCLSLWMPRAAIPAALFFGMKMVIDYWTLRLGARMLDERFRILDFLIAELLHMPYILIVTAAAQILPSNWKGRKVLKWQILSF